MEGAPREIRLPSAAVPLARASPREPAAQASPRAPPTRMCRICWGEGEGGQGALLSPCACRGTSEFIHTRCLQQWCTVVARRKGLAAASRCDVCREPFALPDDWRVRLPLALRARQAAARAAAALAATPAGRAVAPAAAGWLDLTRHAVRPAAVCGALAGAAGVPALVLAARADPRALLPTFLPRLALSVAVDAATAGDSPPVLDAALFYCAGWALDAGAAAAQAALAAAGAAAGAGPAAAAAAALARAALWAPRALGFAMQAVDLFLLACFSGTVTGAIQGVVLPARAAGWLLSRGLGAAAAALAALLGRARGARAGAAGGGGGGGGGGGNGGGAP